MTKLYYYLPTRIVMKEVTKIIGVCKKAEFIFNTNTGLALYLDFLFIEDNQGCAFYVTELAQLNDIQKILCEDKTGLAKESFDRIDIQNLVNKKAVLFTGGLGEKCYFDHWLA